MLCQMRVNEAKRLLMETGHPISEISELCGFNDPERMAVVLSDSLVNLLPISKVSRAKKLFSQLKVL